VEPILDESSLVPCSTRCPGARIEALAQTLQALDGLGVATVLRSVQDAPDRDLGAGRGLRGWCFDPNTPRDAGRLVANRLSKQPYIDGDGGLFAKAEGARAAEALVDGRQVVGLGLAAMTDAIVVALATDQRTAGGVITVDITYVDDDGQQEEHAEVFAFTTAQEVADARQIIIDRVGSYIKKPSEAFRAAVQGSPDLILHPDALNDADQLVEHRWRFAEEGAKLLARYAASEDLGPLREWKQKFAVDFAANGRVSFKYRWTCKGEYREGSTEWHLKEGDNTSKRSAARIYFARVEFGEGARIVVLYVGPHPEDGERTLVFTAP
jgi:hypothetical protein